VLYHHGCPQRRQLMKSEGRDWLEALALPETARQQITVSLAMTDALDAQLEPLSRQLRCYARRQIGCKALISQHYGIGEMCAVTILAELGDCRRFDNSRDAVRYGGMDITVYQSDRHRAPGRLSRQGPPALRWALYEAAHAARRPGSPDRTYYEQAAERLGGTAPVWRSRASCSSAAITRSANSARTPSRHPPTNGIAGTARPASSGSSRRTERPATREPADALAA
jgi:transposase